MELLFTIVLVVSSLLWSVLVGTGLLFSYTLVFLHTKLSVNKIWLKRSKPLTKLPNASPGSPPPAPLLGSPLPASPPAPLLGSPPPLPRPQSNLSMMMMVPGLTEDECERYQELLEIKCQYERTGVAARSSRLLAQEEVTGARLSGGPEEGQEEEEEEVLSRREVALMEEELRHLEFKCRNILRAQKMQQLRERCLKTWTTEEETGNHGNPLHTHASVLTCVSMFLCSCSHALVLVYQCGVH